MDRFSQILYDLSLEVGGGVKLFIDEHRVCQLNYDDQLHLQLHYDEAKEQLMIASFICDVPPGKYREKLLKATLIANGEFPRMGTFGYSERNNKLTLFHYVSSEKASGEEVFKTLNAFIEKGLEWKNAVEGGLPLPQVGKGPKESGDSMFGLKP